MWESHGSQPRTSSFPVPYNGISVTATVSHYEAFQQLDKAATQKLNEVTVRANLRDYSKYPRE